MQILWSWWFKFWTNDGSCKFYDLGDKIPKLPPELWHLKLPMANQVIGVRLLRIHPQPKIMRVGSQPWLSATQLKVVSYLRNSIPIHEKTKLTNPTMTPLIRTWHNHSFSSTRISANRYVAYTSIRKYKIDGLNQISLQN